MIVQNIIQESGRLFVVTKSDQGYKIRKVGTEEIYDEAYDLYPSPYTYEEIIPEPEPEPEEGVDND